MFMLFETYTIFLPLTFFVFVILFLFFIPSNSFYKKIFSGFFIQLYFHFSKSIFSSLHFIVLMFFLILFFNVYGLVPGVFPVTSMPSMTLMFAFLFWGGGYFVCLLLNFKSCLAHFLPGGAPMFLSVVLVWIEFISWLCRPLALGIRLMANITAGHLLLHLFSMGAFVLSGSVMFFLPVFTLLGMLFILEVAVSFIQSYVYSLLLTLYMIEGME
nr:ATP synthase F0 subunit 6 [Microcosmus sp. z YZ-2024]